MAGLNETQIPGALALRWQALALMVVASPHLWRLPWWALLLAVGCLFWRYNSEKFALPGRLGRLLLVMALLFLTFSSLGFRGVVVDVSVTLLFGGIFLKLLEMKNARDYLFVMSLGFLLITTQFIYSQGIPVAVYMMVSVYLLLVSMISLQRTGRGRNSVGSSAYGGQILLYSIPILLVLFLLVPRIAPLWSMPSPAESATTGVSDEMSPGDITELGRSGGLALRARFDQAPPAPELLYWRGLVLDHFDGRSWSRTLDSPRRSSHSVVLPRPADSNALEYDVIMEPSGRNWAYSLELSRRNEGDLWQDARGVFYDNRRVTRRIMYSMTAWPNSALDVSELSADDMALNRQLPDSGNERSRALASEWWQEAGDETEFVQSILTHFREQEFYYTLAPQSLASDSIDDFLFETREGFCEHYAGAMVFLLRSAGIPARVVVGYQGGEYNRFDDYLMVYHYNAHAWTEYWQEGAGWQRVDPTMAVAPSRILDGAEQWFATQQDFLRDSGLSMIRFRAMPWINTLRLRLDAVDHAWSRWVLAYDAGMQNRLVQRLTGMSASTALPWLLAITLSFVLLICALLVFRFTGRVSASSALRSYQRFARIMERRGLSRQINEGPYDFLLRARLEDPSIARHAERITRLFSRLHYGILSGKRYRLTELALRREVTRLRNVFIRQRVSP